MTLRKNSIRRSRRGRRPTNTARCHSFLESLEPRRLLSAPNGPYGLIAAATSPTVVSLRFSDNATDETGFVIQRSINGGDFTTLKTLPAHDGTGQVSATDDTVSAGS